MPEKTYNKAWSIICEDAKFIVLKTLCSPITLRNNAYSSITTHSSNNPRWNYKLKKGVQNKLLSCSSVPLKEMPSEIHHFRSYTKRHRSIVTNFRTILQAKTRIWNCSFVIPPNISLRKQPTFHNNVRIVFIKCSTFHPCFITWRLTFIDGCSSWYCGVL